MAGNGACMPWGISQGICRGHRCAPWPIYWLSCKPPGGIVGVPPSVHARLVQNQVHFFIELASNKPPLPSHSPGLLVNASLLQKCLRIFLEVPAPQGSITRLQKQYLRSLKWGLPSTYVNICPLFVCCLRCRAGHRWGSC